MLKIITICLLVRALLTLEAESVVDDDSTFASICNQNTTRNFRSFWIILTKYGSYVDMDRQRSPEKHELRLICTNQTEKSFVVYWTNGDDYAEEKWRRRFLDENETMADTVLDSLTITDTGKS